MRQEGKDIRYYFQFHGNAIKSMKFGMQSPMCLMKFRRALIRISASLTSSGRTTLNRCGISADAPGLSPSSGGGSKLNAPAAPLSIEVWSELSEAFRDSKLLSGEIKGSAWERIYRHHMKHGLGAMAMPGPLQHAPQLLEGLAKIWADKPGGRTRQIQMPCTTALLRWAREEQRLGEEWPTDCALRNCTTFSSATAASGAPMKRWPHMARTSLAP